MRSGVLFGFVLFVTVAATAGAADRDETLTVSRVQIPLGSGESAFCVSLPEDGKLIGFQSSRPGGYGQSDIWFSRLENGRWSKPFNPGPGINTSDNEVDVKFSPDGLSVIFIRAVSSQVFVSHFRDGKWSEAELIPPPISLPGARQYGALLLNDGKTIYFSSDRKGGYGDLDNYYSERKGDQWGEPVNFGPQINTPDQDADMAVSKDGNVIIFPSKRSDSINGSTDLYITRKVNNGWSPPENLGPRINTPETDTCPWLTYDGQTLYLHSDWDGLLFGKKGPMSTWAFRYPKGFH